MLNRILDFVFPCYCIICGVFISSKFCSICDSCYKKIRFIQLPVCIKCSRPSAAKLCFECKNKKYNYNIFFAPTYYEGVIKEVIHCFKYNGRRSFKKILGLILYNNFPEIFKTADYLIPVPLHPKRELQRGYNQAYYISCVLSKYTGIPVLNNIVYRNKYTPPQTELALDARLKNVFDVFSIKKNKKALIKNKSVIIVDDVYTTGSTINELAKVLKECSPKEINVLTVAR